MSFILKALKKSEREHFVGKIASQDILGHGFEDFVPTNKPAQKPGIIRYGIYIGVILGLIGAYWLGRGEWRSTLKIATSQPSEVTPLKLKGTDKPLPYSAINTIIPPTIQAQPSSFPLPITTAQKTVIDTLQPVSPPEEKYNFPLKATEVYADRVETPGVIQGDGLSDGPHFSTQVVGVRNGCLIEIKPDDQLKKVRLADIYCMKPKSMAGKKARKFITHDAFTKRVTIARWKETVDGTLVADVYTQSSGLLSRALVRAGLAKVEGRRFYEDEKMARHLKIGLWQDQNRWLYTPEEKRSSLQLRQANTIFSPPQ